jgi:hypothetical protein
MSTIADTVPRLASQSHTPARVSARTKARAAYQDGACVAVEYPITGITGYPTDDPASGPPVALALVTQAPELASPIRGAGELAAAFLAGYGPATREAYARDLAPGATISRASVSKSSPLTAYTSMRGHGKPRRTARRRRRSRGVCRR